MKNEDVSLKFSVLLYIVTVVGKAHIHKVGKPNRYLGGNLGRMRKFLASERKFLG